MYFIVYLTDGIMFFMFVLKGKEFSSLTLDLENVNNGE